MMVQAVMKELTPAETVYVRVKGHFPTRANSRLTTAYTAAYEQITYWRRVAMHAVSTHEGKLAAQGALLSGDEASDDASAIADTDSEGSDSASNASAAVSDVQDKTLADVWCSAVLKELTGTEDTELPQLPPERQVSRDKVKKEAKFWTKRFLREGNVHDAPPSVKGTKRQRCLPIYAQIRQKILRGWKDALGRWHAYFSLDDLERRDRRAFAADAQLPPDQQKLKDQKPYHELKAELGIKGNRYVWQHLKAVYPYMRRVKHYVRRARKDRAQVVVRIPLTAYFDCAWPLCQHSVVLGHHVQGGITPWNFHAVHVPRWRPPRHA